MKQMEYFGDYQPLDGRIDFLCRRAFEDSNRFSHRRIYCREDDGIFTILIDKKDNKIYHLKVIKKKKRPKNEPVKDEPKAAILKIFIDWCAQNEIYSKDVLDSITYFSKGAVIEDNEENENGKDGLYALDLIKKARMPR